LLILLLLIQISKKYKIELKKNIIIDSRLKSSVYAKSVFATPKKRIHF